MNKKYILLSIPLMSLFLMCSIMAFDFSVRGSDIVNVYGNDYQVKVNLWHDDGREPTFYPYRHNTEGGLGVWSNGIAPSGKGTIQVKSVTKGLNYNFNLNLKEESSSFSSGTAFVSTDAKGTFWYKGMYPQPIVDTISYTYDSVAGTVSIFDGYDSITISVE